ncbi:putative Cytochrome p450 monooxygenase [Seiridium cardinale]|uniref:Cytochrome p450 monooxygenase n=1 Tax=Seiridium cardinale TaxID=138064 RepID=A0ABR2Y812_9PEZI
MLKPDDANLGVINGVPSNLTATTEDLARVRKLFSPAFSERALRKQEPVFQKYATLLMSKLRDLGDNGKPVEMTQLFNFTIFDAMVELRFSHPLGLLVKNEFQPWVAAIFGSLKTIPLANMIQYCPIIDALFARVEPIPVK